MILDTETSKSRKEERDRLLREGSDKSTGMNILAFILMSLFGLKKENINTPEAQEMLSTFSSALGLDKDAFNQTVTDIQSGKTTVVTAATSIINKIDHSTVDWDKAVKTIPTPKISPIGKIDIGERQQTIVDTIPKAAAATGIHPDFMKGLWGIESSFGQNLVSKTGCEGDWQFSQGAWNDMMTNHGDEIAALIKEKYPEKAAELLENHKKLGSLDDYQYDPVVSTYASAFLSKRNVKSLGINPMQRESWGLLYAAYNAGAGNAKELKAIEASGDISSVMAKIGKAAAFNPYFYKGGASASTALNRYQNVIEQRLGEYNQQLAHLENNENIQVASINQTIFNSGGTEENDRAQPDPLTDKFDGNGVDQVVLAAKTDEPIPVGGASPSTTITAPS